MIILLLNVYSMTNMPLIWAWLYPHSMIKTDPESSDNVVSTSVLAYNQ